tara:strand:+ start:497 stop:643 length:147 start_codon:yes stop_codon:yes gene_type:complete
MRMLSNELIRKRFPQQDFMTKERFAESKSSLLKNNVFLLLVFSISVNE